MRCEALAEAVDDKRLVSFWENLKDAVTEETQDGTFLHLKEGTYFLGLPAYLDKLYVRQEYKVVSDLLDTLHTTETCVAVIGTPGNAGPRDYLVNFAFLKKPALHFSRGLQCCCIRVICKLFE